MILNEIIKTFNLSDPLDVVSLIAKYHNLDLKNATVILVVNSILIDEMLRYFLQKHSGRHRRVLETLNDCHRIEEYNVNTLMNDLHYNLTEKYHNAIFSTVEDVRLII
ncbi:6760_t:CDS:2 [Funneliformis mosseae]|uniref:6760_t:CDS:1 n=1 Tax=Funneliformis mosseae TaxID=27381 RepID=A0A9N9D9X5_FUNMO|nr:6760_t:CDS:2 [Funneliformis mosseae]